MRSSRVQAGMKVIVKKSIDFSPLKVGDIGEIAEIRSWQNFKIIRVVVEGSSNDNIWTKASAVKAYQEESLLKRILNLVGISLLIK